MTAESIMTGWTIYDHPSDYPDVFIARKWIARRDGTVEATPSIVTSKDIMRLRAEMMQMGLVKMMRSPGDDPKIMEVWI